MKTLETIPTTAAAGTIYGCWVDLGDIQTFACEVVFSGTDVVGTLTLESANDSARTPITVASSSTAVSSSGSVMYNVTNAGYRYVRPKFVYTSGTGNITGTVILKELRVVGA